MMHVADIFGRGGRLASCLQKFEPRSGQSHMAEAVMTVLLGQHKEEQGDLKARVLMVEAETGIGKTLAYLIPAILSGKRVVVSTATLNLQDQIINKDLPLVEKVVDQKISALCIKGRENYLCHYRWYQYCSNPQLSLVDDPWVAQIDNWLKKTETGDRAELDWLSKKTGFWSKISAQSKHCLGADCPEATSCFINQLRKKAGSSQVLIVNHHLFFSDLTLKKAGYGELMPRYEAVIFDEAHHVENTASAFFGNSFSQYQVIDLLGDVERLVTVELPQDLADSVLPSLTVLKMHLEAFSRTFPQKTGRFFLQSLITDITQKAWREEIEKLSSSIADLADQLKACSHFGENWNVLAKRAEELNQKLREIGLFFDHDDHSFVHWYEKRERAIIISATPIEVAAELRENLYSSVDCCILTSATLSSGGSFSYIKERLGLDEDAHFLQFSSPFDYQNRALVYVPEATFPDPGSAHFHDLLGARVLEILKLSEGRALVLCTSFRGMDLLATFLLNSCDFQVLVQGSASRSSLLKSFREETHSVLLAVASFWEGIDVVGESLSCLIIEKLPFEVPSDPVIQARIERIKESGGKPFFDFQVPRAILTLRQGVGRLMRSVSDRGVIAIMDVRLFSKGYGRIFMKSLPPAPISRELIDIEHFYTVTDAANPPQPI